MTTVRDRVWCSFTLSRVLPHRRSFVFVRALMRRRTRAELGRHERLHARAPNRRRALAASVLVAMAAAAFAACSSPNKQLPSATPSARALPESHGDVHVGPDGGAGTDGSDESDDAFVPGEPPLGPVTSAGNHGIRVFSEAKKVLSRIYTSAGAHTDLYCGCSFVAEPGHGMRVDLIACGYVPARDAARATRIEWEHAVPASFFGHTFDEWRTGHPKCVDARRKPFHGRSCARAQSAEFARIEADLHNLFPVVGEVNGLRADLPMGILDAPARSATSHARAGRSHEATFSFGACRSAITRGVFVPREEVRGDLARAFKYMSHSYPERVVLDDPHRALFDTWDRQDPPDAWERERNRLIRARQGNANPYIGE